MSDTSVFSPESTFAASSGAAPSVLDASAIDRNLRQLSAVEKSSRLPALPDAVKLDLASMDGASEDSLLDLMLGLDHDLNDEDEADQPQIQIPRTDRFDVSGVQQAQMILAGISNNPPPQAATPDAVRLFKKRAVEEGYLDMPADRIDSSWSPEFNRVRNEMLHDDYNRSLRDPMLGIGIGTDNKPNTAMRLLNDFTSPSGLLAAATELDFLPDFKAINREWRTWGDKWREVGHSKNPWDFAKNLVDAVTGPIDDIVFPVINTALLFTGVGGLFDSARIGWMSGRFAESAGLWGRLWQGAAASHALNLEEIGRASWLAGKLQKTESLAGLGRGLEAWRAYKPVKAIKRGVQVGMRLGFAQQLESRFPGYQGGTASLGDIGPIGAAGEFLERAQWSPVAAPFEVMFAPYNIFTPGTFVRRAEKGIGLLSEFGVGAKRALGTVPGRAAAGALVGIGLGAALGDDTGDVAKGAVLGAGMGAALPVIGRILNTKAGASTVKGAIVGGVAGAWLGDSPEDAALGAIAGAGFMNVTDTARLKLFQDAGFTDRAIRNIGRKMVSSSFIPLANEHWGTYGFDQGMRWRLGRDPQALADWVDDVERHGVLTALANRQGTDLETAAANVVFEYQNNAIEWIAHNEANLLGKKGYRGRFLAAKTKLTNQLKHFDVEDMSEGRLHELARAMAFTERGDAPLSVVYKYEDQLFDQLIADPVRAAELMNGHNMRAAETARQLVDPTNFPKATDLPFEMDDAQRFGPEAVSRSLGERFALMPRDGRAWTMAKHMQGVRTFDNFPAFLSATHGVREARLDNLFDGAKLVPFRTVDGHLGSVADIAKLENKEKAAVNAAVTKRLFDVDKEVIGDLNVTPSAEVMGRGAVTPGLIGKKWKHDLKTLRSEISDLRSVHADLARMTDVKAWRRQVSELLGLPEDAKLADLQAKQVEAILSSVETVPVSPGQGQLFESPLDYMQVPKAHVTAASAKTTRRLLNYARRNNLSLLELDQAITRHADDLSRNAELWRGFDFDELAFDDQGRALFGMEALNARLKEINEAIPFRAAKIDTDDLIRYLRESGNQAGADKMEALVRGLEGDGYELVHGVEFLQPEDLAHGPIFADITRRHQNAATLGNAFRRRTPIENLIREDRRHRLALVEELSKTGLDLHPEDARVTQIIYNLNDLLHQVKEPVNSELRRYHQQTFTERFLTRLRTVATPVRVDDLARRPELVAKHLKETTELSDNEIKAVQLALHRFRSADFQELGLYAFETKARNLNVAEWGLKTLTGSKYGDSLSKTARGVAEAEIGAALVGAGIAGAGAEVASDGDLSWDEKLAALASGALVGAGLRGAGVGIGQVLNQAARVAGGKTLVDRAAHWRYGYLFDHLAQLRDSLRFTLSPIFDASRYTEGLFLAQTAAPTRYAQDTVDAAGVLHKAGDRFVLPINMTARKLRRTLGPEAYDAGIREFQNAARVRHDFDAEALDSTGRWFKQMGILGFSPVDWMGTAYVHLKNAGLSPQEAYEAARQMYTYGVRGRSAAEMSANFLFFPFSFQKKALGHMAKWMNDDLARSIIIHDALQTYQLLDQRYDLDQRWKDHFPWLQQLQRLNLLAYGLGPGRFGGINSQMFESAGKLAWNLFVPAAMEIKNVSMANELKDTMRQLTPALVDLEWMTKNLKESGNVLFSESHAVSAAEVRRGYDEWNSFKQSFEEELQRRGYTLSDVFNKPWLQEARLFYQAKKGELAKKYPAWQASKEEQLEKMASKDMARQVYVDRAVDSLRNGQIPSIDDQQMLQFEQFLEGLSQQLTDFTGSGDLTGEDVPSAIYDLILDKAVQFAKANPHWASLWGSFFERRFGPIRVPLAQVAA